MIKDLCVAGADSELTSMLCEHTRKFVIYIIIIYVGVSYVGIS